MKLTYKTQGTCSRHIELEVENGIIQQVFFWGGCNGNLQGISRLVKGMRVEEAIAKLEGTDRELLVLHYFAARPLGELAALLGLTNPAARQRLHRARAKLRHILEEDGYEI